MIVENLNVRLGNSMIPRDLTSHVQRLASWFPVVSVTGPRQSGKSTIVKHAFPEYAYVNLEDPQLRKAANDDPVGFIRNRPEHLIVDEAQYASDLFSMIQVVSDERSTRGQYVLSGSQNFLLLKNISQSLAGRVGLVRLLPLSFKEVSSAALLGSPNPADDFMLRGGYPRLYSSGMPLELFFSSYLSTYVEHDVAGYLDVRNVTTFHKFLRLCALNAGNLMNYAKLANDTDISARTAKSWLSILESSYVTFELMPYYANEGKRMIKTPKIFFYDTGLLCYLLGITSKEQLLLSTHLGAIFENLIISETLKRHCNRGEEPQLFFYRDDRKVEVDLLDYTDSTHPEIVEIKSGQTYRDAFARHLNSIGEDLGIAVDHRFVVARVESSFQAKDAQVCSAADWLAR